jgi:hypothetical protein
MRVAFLWSPRSGNRYRYPVYPSLATIRRPIGMRIYGIPMRIYVQGVPLDTTWFCPYCCATVDTGFITLQKHSKQNADARSPHSSIGYSRSALSLRET